MVRRLEENISHSTKRPYKCTKMNSQPAPHERKIRKATRRKARQRSNRRLGKSEPPPQGVSEPKSKSLSANSEMSTSKHATKGDRERGKGRNESIKSVACPKLKTKCATAVSKPSSSNTCRQMKEEILKQIMVEAKPLKLFKIPKKKTVESAVMPVSPKKIIGSVKSESSRSEQNKVDDHDVFKPPSFQSDPQVDEPMDCEEMEWETTVQEIKGFWSGSHFRSSDGLGDERNPATDVMDVDIVPFRLVIVPDTNIWIHDINLLRKLLDTKFDSHNYPTIVIPWMVLQELDIQGKSPNSPSRGAINFIHKLLSTNHPRVRGQKASDAATVIPGFDKVADDSILQCAQQCQSSGSTVILLTNDRNLTNKAMVNGVKACDGWRGINGIRDILNDALKNNNDTESPFAFSPRPAKTDFKPFSVNIDALPSPQSSRDRIECNNPRRSKRPYSPARGNEQKRSKINYSDLKGIKPLADFDDVMELAGKTLSYVIEKKMKEEYGDPGWLDAVKIQPPWTLRTAVHCIIKHWISVFSEVFGRRVTVAEKLLSSIQKYDGGSSNAKLEEDILESILGMFVTGEFATSDLVREDEQVGACRKALLAYLQQLKMKSNNLLINDET